MTTNSSEQHTTTYIPEASPNQSKKYSRYSISKLFSRSSRKLREVESAPVLARENNAAVQAPQQTKKQIFWPQDLLPLKLPKSRIFTWGYDVDIDHPFGSASTATVFQHASNLLSDLTDVRMSWEEKQRPIIFIAHSLGGIVVKDVSNLVPESRSNSWDIVIGFEPVSNSNNAPQGNLACHPWSMLLRNATSGLASCWTC